MRRALFKFRFVSLVFVAVVVGAWPMAAQAAVGQTAAGFAILANTAMTCTTSTVTGDVGVFTLPPPAAMTFTTCPVTGTIHVQGDAATQAAYADFLSAYAALALVPCDTVLTGTLAGRTLAPGVYCFDAAAALTGKLTLRGPANGIWLFKIGTGLTGGALTGTNLSVVMAGGGQPCNVNWWAAGAATLTNSTLGLADSTFQGNILAGAGGTVTGSATIPLSLKGNVWAKAAVTVTNSKILGCTGATAVPTGNRCDKGGGKDADENSDKSKDTADSSAPVKSATDRTSTSSHGDGKDESGKHSEGDGHNGCDSGDSNNDNKDNKDNKKKSGD